MMIGNARESKFSERHLFLDDTRRDCRIFGATYEPDCRRVPAVGILYLPPLGAERNVVDAAFANLARDVADKGFIGLRIDYYGTGDSEGGFEDITLESMIHDVDLAITYMREQYEIQKIGIFGLRFGALLAAHYVALRGNISFMCLCAPIGDGLEFVNKELMHVIASQTVLFGKVHFDRRKILDAVRSGVSIVVGGYDLRNMNGFPLSKTFLSSVENIQLQNCEGYDCKNMAWIDLFAERRTGKLERELAVNLGWGTRGIYKCVYEKGLPWVHGKYCMKVLPLLNDAFLACLEEWFGESV